MGISLAKSLNIWDYGRYDRGLSFLEGLVLSAQDRSEMKEIDKRLVHNQVRPTPYCYRESNLLLVLAITPVHGFRAISHVIETISKKLMLRKFSKPELEVIFEHLLEVYRCAYPEFTIELARKETIFNTALKKGGGEVREFIKFSVEAFDWIRLGMRTPGYGDTETRGHGSRESG